MNFKIIEEMEMEALGLDAAQETKITVMQLKIERLEEKQDDLRERLKAV